MAPAAKIGLLYVDDPDRMRQLIRAGVSGIITNCPKRMRELLEGMKV